MRSLDNRKLVIHCYEPFKQFAEYSFTIDAELIIRLQTDDLN